METLDTKGFTAPSRPALAEPGLTLSWMRREFDKAVQGGQDPQEAIAQLQQHLTSLGYPERVIVTCRVSETETVPVSFAWKLFEARLDKETGRWFLYMPAAPLKQTQLPPPLTPLETTP